MRGQKQKFQEDEEEENRKKYVLLHPQFPQIFVL
jgi:hypothetical protein